LFVASFLLLVFSQAWAGTEKVEVCHIPPDDPGNFHTITISEAALKAHLAHGDFTGSCDTPCETLCDDSNPCTIDACLPGTKTCVDVANRENTCCISVHEDCDPNSAVNATFCGAGPHAVVTPAGRDPISYVKILSPDIQSVTLTHCIDASSLSGQTLDILGDTSLCELEGGDAGNPRWNDSVCFVEMNF
jgi:hypothetical protein